MEFVARQSALLRELNLIQGVVEKKNTVPILANVLLSASTDVVEVMATDLEVSVRSSLTAGVTRPGALSVSARKLHEIVRALPDSEVEIKSDGDNWATITCERSHFRLMGLPKDDFPTLMSPGKGDKVTFGVQQFREMVQKVIFAVTVDDARFALNGALMVLEKGTICLVASDGHRLAYVARPVEGGRPVDRDIRVVIPHKALGELLRIAEEIGGEIVFSRQENQIFFEMGRCTLSSRLLEGQFPNYEKVLPKGNDKVIELDRTAFFDAVRRISLIANERNRAVKVSLAKGRLEISSKNPELGEARENVSVDYGGGEVEIGFNAKYLMDFLGVVESETVVFELKDEATQGLLRPGRNGAAAKQVKSKGAAKDGNGAAQGGGEYKYVVMPMRI
ncbi:MAG TPA: DNA polymerase III subunit beta [Candidatus Polarisedimenticolia bacterium]|nr:DNA polymerase III subunit beta [Candidatus Polarisedimenticolia bacterium]